MQKSCRLSSARVRCAQHDRARRPLAGLVFIHGCDAVVHHLQQGSGRALPAHKCRSNPHRSIGGAPSASSSRSCWQQLAQQGSAHGSHMDGTPGALPACIIGTLRGSEHLRIGAVSCCLPLDRCLPTGARQPIDGSIPLHSVAVADRRSSQSSGRCVIGDG